MRGAAKVLYLTGLATIHFAGLIIIQVYIFLVQISHIFIILCSGYSFYHFAKTEIDISSLVSSFDCFTFFVVVLWFTICGYEQLLIDILFIMVSQL